MVSAKIINFAVDARDHFVVILYTRSKVNRNQPQNLWLIAIVFDALFDCFSKVHSPSSLDSPSNTF
jgi:hypothetical protein